MNDTDKAKAQETRAAFEKFIGFDPSGEQSQEVYDHRKTWNAAIAWHTKEVVEPLEKEMDDIKDELELVIEERDSYRKEKDEWRELAEEYHSSPMVSDEEFETLNQKYPNK